MGKRVTGVWFDRAVFESKASCPLNATAIRVYLAFLTKRQLHKRRNPRGGEDWTIFNNGEIEFTYKEAEAEYGIKQGAFRENRDLLVEVVLMDIAQSGAGMYKAKTLYAISERWRKYGTPDFQDRTRAKDSRHIEYQAKNKRNRGTGPL